MAYTDVISTENFPEALEGGEAEGMPDTDFQEPEAPSRFPPRSPAGKLERWAQEDNLTDEFTEEKLLEIGRDAVRDYGIDENSRSDWKADMDKAFDLALQVTQDKSYPWPGASNVIYPLVTTAALQFNARAYPAIVDGKNIVKAKVNGKDPDGSKKKRAERVSRHMSWQLLEQMEEWEEETDRELLQVPIVGCAFRKTYRDTSLNRNVSKLVSAADLVVNDETTRSMESCPRITELCRFYPHEIETKFRKKLWRKIEIEYDDEDRQKTELFLEQHCHIDLDEDGYAEPYIVTVHHDNQEVVCITACFDPEGIEADETGKVLKVDKVQYYTKVPFLPHPKGRFYDLGFGFLLKYLNHTINTTLNQLLDAGHLANVPSGFIGRGPEMRAGSMRFRPGEMKFLNTPGGVIRDAIVMNDFKGPNAVLFSLMEYLVNAAREMISVQDAITGDSPSTEQPTTLFARIEQAMKQMVTIFKRIHRARKKEYQKLYRLNRIHMDVEEYFTFQDEPETVHALDYEDESLDVSPASDPTMISDMQKMARAQAEYEWATTSPYANRLEAEKRFLAVLGVDDPEMLLQEPQQDPGLMLEIEKLKTDRAKVMVSRSEAFIKRAKMMPEIMEIIAKAEKAASEAEATMAGIQLNDIRAVADLLMNEHKMDMEVFNALGQEQSASDTGGRGAVAGQSGNATGSRVLSGLGGNAQAALGGMPGRRGAELGGVSTGVGG